MLDTINKMKVGHDQDTAHNQYLGGDAIQRRALVNEKTFLFFNVKTSLSKKAAELRDIDIWTIAERVLQNQDSLDRWFSIYCKTSLSEHGALICCRWLFFRQKQHRKT